MNFLENSFSFFEKDEGATEAVSIYSTVNHAANVLTEVALSITGDDEKEGDDKVDDVRENVVKAKGEGK